MDGAETADGIADTFLTWGRCAAASRHRIARSSDHAAGGRREDERTRMQKMRDSFPLQKQSRPVLPGMPKSDQQGKIKDIQNKAEGAAEADRRSVLFSLRAQNEDASFRRGSVLGLRIYFRHRRDERMQTGNRLHKICSGGRRRGKKHSDQNEI